MSLRTAYRRVVGIICLWVARGSVDTSSSSLLISSLELSDTKVYEP